MENSAPPPYGFHPYPPTAPPTYAQAISAPTYKETGSPAIVTAVVPVGPHPTHMICPSCHAEIDTTVRTKPGVIAYVSGILIFALGCWFGCCLLPCCMDDCMDVHHKCPHCDAYLGRYRR